MNYSFVLLMISTCFSDIFVVVKMKMLKVKKEKLALFGIGLATGIILGILLMQYQLIKAFSETSPGEKIEFLFNRVYAFFSHKGDIPQRTILQENKDFQYRRTKKTAYAFGGVLDTTGMTDKASLDELFAQLDNGEISDSLFSDSAINEMKKMNVDENIIVRTDRMLTTKNLAIEGFDSKTQKQNEKLDSLLVEDNTKHNATMRVEYWESPVNYKGYKLSQNKLVLFGIVPLEPLSLKVVGRAIYLKYQSNYYALEVSDEFRPFRMVVNDQIIKLLNK